MTADSSTTVEQFGPVEGVDLVALARYLPAFIPEAEGPLTAKLVSGGRSNLTYYIRSANGEWILRRPPLGHVLPTAHDMAREYRVISALRDTDVPVPQTYVLCQDPEVIGAPFYVMERVRGEIVRETLPPGFADLPEQRTRMSEVFIDTLVKLHAVDYATIGLGDFGRPEGFLARQIRRWGEQWDRSKTRDLPAIEELRTRLAKALPDSPPPTIVHGDYRIENMISSRFDTIIAILDWEMATLGDPLADLGYALMYWGQPGDSEIRQLALSKGVVSIAEGFYTRERLAARYAEQSGRRVDHIEYYLTFGLYKLAIIAEGILARFLNGQMLGEGFEGIGERVPDLAELALETASSSGDPALRGEI